MVWSEMKANVVIDMFLVLVFVVFGVFFSFNTKNNRLSVILKMCATFSTDVLKVAHPLCMRGPAERAAVD